MIKLARKQSLKLSAAVVTGAMMSSSSAFAAGTTNFGTIAENVQKSISSVPGLLSGLSYMFGILLGVLGVLKIKDHVENPGNNPLKEGAIRLAAGGALFALPIIYSAMTNTVNNGATATATNAATLQHVGFGVDTGN